MLAESTTFPEKKNSYRQHSQKKNSYIYIYIYIYIRIDNIPGAAWGVLDHITPLTRSRQV